MTPTHSRALVLTFSAAKNLTTAGKSAFHLSHGRCCIAGGHLHSTDALKICREVETARECTRSASVEQRTAGTHVNSPLVVLAW